MTFIRRDTTRKGWKPNKNGAGRVMQINSTSDQKKVMYVTLEDAIDIEEGASLILNEQVKDMCLKLWWLQNNYGCWKHFFRARITWAQAKEDMRKAGKIKYPQFNGTTTQVYLKKN